MTRQRNHHISQLLYHNITFVRFYERMAGRFANILWDNFLNNFLKKIPDGATLLEIGAGPGIQAIRILERRPNLKIIVTDFSPKMLELAKANLDKAIKNSNNIGAISHQLEFVQANAIDLSQFSNRKIDGVYSMGAIKHFSEPLKCLNQAKNIISQHGVMYFTDFCSDGKYSGVKEIVANLNLSPLMSRLMSPIIYIGIKREAPSHAEVMSWTREFGDGTELKAQFYAGGFIFTLTNQ